MNSKKNSFKRVAAGALAVLTVAAYTAPVANVGGLTNPLVANAAVGDKDVKFDWSDIAGYVTSITVNGTTIKGSQVTNSDNYTFQKADGTTATIVCTVPITNYVETTKGYVDKSAEYKNGTALEAGQYALATKTSGGVTTYTYTVALKDTNDKDPWIVVGDTQSAKVYFLTKDNNPAANPTIKPADATQLANLKINNNAIDLDAAAAVGVTSIIDSTVTVTCDNNFSIAVYDGAKATSTLDPIVQYSTTTKMYTTTFTMPKFVTGKETKLDIDNDGTDNGIAYNDGVNDNVFFVIRPQDPAALSYTVKNNQLLANGDTVEANSVAAKITATQKRAEVKDENDVIIDKEIKAGTELAYGGSMKYGSKAGDGVSLTIERDTKLTKELGGTSAAKDNIVSVSIKKDGEYVTINNTRMKEVGYDDLAAINALLNFKEAGSYEITAEFYVAAKNGGTDYKEINFKFNIDAIDVTGSDATISLEYTDPVTHNVITENSNLNKVTPTASKFVDGEILTISVPDELKGTTFDAKIKLPVLDAATGHDPADVTKPGGYEINGTLTATDFNEVNTAKVFVYDQNYGAPYGSYKTITLKYKLVKEVQQPAIEALNGAPEYDALTDTLKVAVDDTNIKDFTEIFWNNFKGNATVEENKDHISFEYLEGTNRAAATDDLDSHNPGVPTKKSDINYTLYVLYDGEVFDAMNLEIVSVKAKIVPKSSALTMTYGDAFDNKSYTLTDSKGKTLKNIKLNDVFFTSVKKAKDKDDNKDGVQAYKDVDGKYVARNNVNYAVNGVLSAVNAANLDADTYIVTLSAPTDDSADYTVASDEFILTVEKRQITGDMIRLTANSTKIYTGAQQSVAINDFEFSYEKENNVVVSYPLDANNDGDYMDPGDVEMSDLFKVSGGDTKGTAATEYTIKIAALSDNKNFTGTASVNWYIASKSNAKQNIVAFDWDPDNTILYDEGRIHVQYAKTNDSKITETDANGDKYKISDYGVIIDKDNKIAAPTTLGNGYDDNSLYGVQKSGSVDNYPNGPAKNAYLDAKNAAEEVLLLGNGFTAGHASDENKAKSIYGANIKVEDVEKGVWVRPYALLNDNTVVYGDAIYLDITREAKKQLQFKLNPATKLDKTKNVAGYDYETGKYTFYASYSKFDTEKVKATVKDFGVIVDKKGSFVNSNNGVVLASDKETSIEDAFKFGKGFTEGHFDPKSEKLGGNEYGAKIKPANSVTGIWVRGYIKLSDSLIIYTEPAYYNSVSEYYAQKDDVTANKLTTFPAYFATLDPTTTATTEIKNQKYNAENKVITPNFTYTHNLADDVTVSINGANVTIPVYKNADLSYQNASGKFKMVFTNNVLSNNSYLEFVAQGVVVDKNETLVTRTYYPAGSTYAYQIKPEAKSKLVLGKGYTEGKKTVASATTYSASVTPNAGKAITVRPYTTFKVKGTDTQVTVYGDVFVVTDASNIFM